MLKSLVTTTLLVTSALALITPRAWPAGNVVCGSTTYTLTQVKAAVTQGYSDYTKGTTVSSYPHTFRNDEGLSMWCSGQSSYQEFPIKTSGVYTSGSPGADRVIFSTSGVYCAVVTHTGASSTNGFVSCKGD